MEKSPRSQIYTRLNALLIKSICISEEGEALAMREWSFSYKEQFLGGNLRYYWSASGKGFLHLIGEY